MHEDDTLLAEALCICRSNVVLTEIFHQRVLHQYGKGGKRLDRVTEHGQEHVMNLRAYLLEKVEVLPVVRTETTQRENTPKATASKKHEQSGSQRPSGH